MTLPADIAALIDAYAHAERTNLWNEGSPFPTPGFVNMVPETRAALESAIAELAAERDRYRDALVARHGGEPLALLSELDAARAERDAAVAKCAELEREMAAAKGKMAALLDASQRVFRAAIDIAAAEQGGA